MRKHGTPSKVTIINKTCPAGSFSSSQPGGPPCLPGVLYFIFSSLQVRAELMQALWRTLRNPSDQIAHVAFRVLGKFGGGNRKMMIEPQALEFIDQDDIGPLLSIAFVDHKQTLSLPVKDIIEVKKYQLHYY
jgi:hypothetical protein